MDIDMMTKRAMLSYLVRTKIFCEKSRRVLDVRTAVAFEICYTSGNTSAVVVHADYGDDVRSRMEDTLAHPLVVRINVYDGRDLFGQRKTVES